MARKTVVYTVADTGRDHDKAFLLTEMPASKAEKWAARAMFAMASNGIEIPDDVMNAGFAGLATFGVSLMGKLPFDVADVLLDEMFACVVRVPNIDKPNVTRALIEDDIEEVLTRVKLRMELFKLHADFFPTAGRSISE